MHSVPLSSTDYGGINNKFQRQLHKIISQILYYRSILHIYFLAPKLQSSSMILLMFFSTCLQQSPNFITKTLDNSISFLAELIAEKTGLILHYQNIFTFLKNSCFEVFNRWYLVTRWLQVGSQLSPVVLESFVDSNEK